MQEENRRISEFAQAKKKQVGKLRDGALKLIIAAKTSNPLAAVSSAQDLYEGARRGGPGAVLSALDPFFGR